MAAASAAVALADAAADVALVVATAVMPLWNGMEGSNLARVGPSILISAEMVDVLNSKADEVSTRKKLQDLSRLFAKEVAAGVAFSLGLPAERVTERLALRLLEDDHFRRYKDLANSRRKKDAYSILGFMFADLEHTMAEMSLVEKSPKK